jgi:rhodanese-related sulfurtransferase
MLGYSLSPQELWSLMATADAPVVVDVRRADVYDASPHLLPAALWRDGSAARRWRAEVGHERTIVVACKAGHDLSQRAAAELRADGCDAHILAGGYQAWQAAGLPLVDKATLDRIAPSRPSIWVTRRRPKIDRVACPWLIHRFLDPQARILFVDPDEVLPVARESGAIPFDIPNVELSHVGERCSFDTMLAQFGLANDAHLQRLALIVRGADTARPELAAEAAGLHAISLGLSSLAGDDDRSLLTRGFIVYDALFAWLRFAAGERHNWPAKAAA